MTTNEIMNTIRENANKRVYNTYVNVFAIRSDCGEYSPGDYMRDSLSMDDGEPMCQLDGTCGTIIDSGIYRDYNDLSDEELVINIEKAISHNAKYLSGTQCLIMGMSNGSGDDDHEVVVEDAIFCGWL